LEPLGDASKYEDLLSLTLRVGIRLQPDTALADRVVLGIREGRELLDDFMRPRTISLVRAILPPCGSMALSPEISSFR
jgi:hypothetical protein